MESERLDMEELNEERRKALAASISPVGGEELRALGEKIFPNFDHPWRETFFEFLDQNAQATFHHATTHDGVQVIYCSTRERGLWFQPDRGMGPLQARGLKTLKEIVATGK